MSMLLIAALAASTIATAPAAITAPTPAPHSAAASPSRTYRGKTSEGGAVRIVVADGHVQLATVIVGRYVCKPEGSIGPMSVQVHPAAPITAGRFAFDAGSMPESLAMRATFGAHRTVRGTLRAHGTIGTGDPCSSPTFRFTARRVTR